MDSGTIFTFFAPVTDKLGIAQDWLAATALNVMTAVAIIKPKFEDLFKGFWRTSILAGVLGLAQAAAEYYQRPLVVLVAIVVLWLGTTVTMKTAEKGIDLGKKMTGNGKPLGAGDRLVDKRPTSPSY